MAKNNNYETYLAQKRKRFGDEWLKSVSLKDINDVMSKKSAERIISDLIRGHYAIGSKDLYDFSSPLIRDSVLNLIKTRVREFTFIHKGIKMQIDAATDSTSFVPQDLQSLLFRFEGAIILYQTLDTYLSAWYATGDPTLITRIVHELKPGPAINNWGNYLSPSKVI